MRLVLSPLTAAAAAEVAGHERAGMDKAREMVVLPDFLTWIEWHDPRCGVPGQRGKQVAMREVRLVIDVPGEIENEHGAIQVAIKKAGSPRAACPCTESACSGAGGSDAWRSFAHTTEGRWRTGCRAGSRLFCILMRSRHARPEQRPKLRACWLDDSSRPLSTVRAVYRDIATLQARRISIEGAAGIGYVLRQGLRPTAPRRNFLGFGLTSPTESHKEDRQLATADDAPAHDDSCAAS